MKNHLPSSTTCILIIFMRLIETFHREVKLSLNKASANKVSLLTRLVTRSSSIAELFNESFWESDGVRSSACCNIFSYNIVIYITFCYIVMSTWDNSGIVRANESGTRIQNTNSEQKPLILFIDKYRIQKDFR